MSAFLKVGPVSIGWAVFARCALHYILFRSFGEVGHPHPSRNVYDRKVILMDESFGTSNGIQHFDFLSLQ